MALILQVFYSVFSGLLLTTGIPNELFLLGNPFYAFISIIPYYIAIKNASSYRRAFLLGFVQALTTHLCSSFWLAYFKDFAIFTLGASALGTALIGAIMALFLYLPFSRTERPEISFYSLKTPFFEASAFRIVYFSVMYTLYEWVKSTGFIGYPWGTISSAMYRWHSFTQLASITGTYGITFLTVMFDAIIAEGAFRIVLSLRRIGNTVHIEDHIPFLQGTIDAAKTFIILFILTLLWGNYEYNKPRVPDKTLTTIMVQQNSDPWLTYSDEETIKTSMALTAQKTEELRKLDREPQLVVWSEGSLQRSFPSAVDYYSYEPQTQPLIEFIRQNSIPLLAGGTYCKDTFVSDDIPHIRKYFNSAVAFDSQGNFRGYYGKLHLVPFAEHIPGINNPIIRKIFRKVVGISAGWNPGEQLTYFEIPCSYYKNQVTPRVNSINISIPYHTSRELSEIPLVRIATPVCFDDSFTDVIRPLFLNGAELFVNLTDDSWSRKKSSEYQHFCIASYRAIEYRTTLVRSTNAGYSVVVDPAGKILCDQPLFEKSAAAFDVPVYERVITPYARFGNWLPYTCLCIFVLVSIMMVCTFVTDDYIPSERKKQLVLKKKKKNTKKNKKK